MVLSQNVGEGQRPRSRVEPPGTGCRGSGEKTGLPAADWLRWGFRWTPAAQVEGNRGAKGTHTVLTERRGWRSMLLQPQGFCSPLGARIHDTAEPPQVTAPTHSLARRGSSAVGRGLAESSSDRQKLDRPNLTLPFTDKKPERAKSPKSHSSWASPGVLTPSTGPFPPCLAPLPHQFCSLGWYFFSSVLGRWDHVLHLKDNKTQVTPQHSMTTGGRSLYLT